MKTLKVYFVTASILLAGAGIASAKQGNDKPKEKPKLKLGKLAAKAASSKKGSSGNDIAVKKQGATGASQSASGTSASGNK